MASTKDKEAPVLSLDIQESGFFDVLGIVKDFLSTEQVLQFQEESLMISGLDSSHVSVCRWLVPQLSAIGSYTPPTEVDAEGTVNPVHVYVDLPQLYRTMKPVRKLNKDEQRWDIFDHRGSFVLFLFLSF